MMRVADFSIWRGRIDTDNGGDNRRLHQVVRSLTPDTISGTPPATVLIGFCCDEGVRRNSGRVGAKDAPPAIRSMLAPMAWHAGTAALFDAGDILCEDTRLEEAQDELAQLVQSSLAASHFPIILGGGHEVAYGTGAGVLAATPSTKSVGIINIDAHFDLRTPPTRNSGSSFADLAMLCRAQHRSLQYLALGISESGNTEALFVRARELGSAWILDEAMRDDPTHLHQTLTQFLAHNDIIHLSIDMDALPSDEAPGVSAPAALGVPLALVLKLITTLAASGKLAAAEIAELNPHYDVDNRTARSAARIIHTLIHRRTP